jgi:hypothetical protein
MVPLLSDNDEVDSKRIKSMHLRDDGLDSREILQMMMMMARTVSVPHVSNDDGVGDTLLE